MKINDGFVLKEVAGNYIAVATGDEAFDLNSIITINELGALIWKKIEEGKSKDEIIKIILSEYDIDEKTAENDFEEFITCLEQNKILTK